MEEREEISVELKALSELVSGIGRQTPYGAPVGYFERFPASVMSRIATNASAGAGPALPAPSSAFQVPEGYFEGFAARVLARIKSGSASDNTPPPAAETADTELARLSPTISRIPRTTPYRLPEGYFDELSPVLAVLRDKPAYAVPQGYFDELAPVLSVAQNRTTFRVPEGYFAALPERILEMVAGPDTMAKVIPLHRKAAKVLKRNWWKYSSAAAIAACFLLIFSRPQVGNKVIEGNKAPDIAMALQKVSDQDMQAYLDDQHTILAEQANTGTATLDLNEGEVQSLLGEVSDNDLQQYMEEHGKADDIATN
ncbi:MAG TPA: hypothetical protein VFE32_08545 [Puia sp.]|jgi:hypothetical protein|nr:hypothetical protein [Puia sp.]